MSATYGWIITHDHFVESPEEPNAVGTIGPRDIAPKVRASLEAGAGVPFKMYDDDQLLMYEGRFLGDPASEAAFGPLDDFGMPNVGCTSIHYANAEGVWTPL